MKRILALARRMKVTAACPPTVSAGQRRLFKLVFAVGLSFCSYLFFSRVVVTAVEVKGASMAPTLRSGDLFILNRFAYLTREPQRGELIVLKDPETGELIVKRIIGLPCETVIMRSEATYVNGRQIYEPYACRNVRPDHSPLGKATVIPRDCYFVLGDNRTRSVDSRTFGPIPRDSILGVITL